MEYQTNTISRVLLTLSFMAPIGLYCIILFWFFLENDLHFSADSSH